MTKNHQKYIVSIGVILLVSVVLYQWAKDLFENAPHYAFLSMTILSIGSLTSHFIIQYVASVKGKPFVQIVLMTFVFRLVLYCLLAFVIILLEDNPFADLVVFGVFYLILTVSEIFYFVMYPIKNSK